MEDESWSKNPIISSQKIGEIKKAYPTRNYRILGSDFLGYLEQEIELFKEDYESITTEKKEFPVIEDYLRQLKASHGLNLKEIKKKRANIILKKRTSTAHIQTGQGLSLYSVTPVNEEGKDLTLTISQYSCFVPREFQDRFEYDFEGRILNFGMSGSFKEEAEFYEDFLSSLEMHSVLDSNLMIFLKKGKCTKEFDTKLNQAIMSLEKYFFNKGYPVCKSRLIKP